MEPYRRARRDFLNFLAASPLLALGNLPEARVLDDPAKALNLFEFEAAARRAISVAHFGYLETGVEDD